MSSFRHRHPVVFWFPEAVRWCPKLRDGEGKPVLDAEGQEKRGVEGLFALDNRRLYVLQRAAVYQYPRHQRLDTEKSLGCCWRLEKVRKVGCIGFILFHLNSLGWTSHIEMISYKMWVRPAFSAILCFRIFRPMDQGFVQEVQDQCGGDHRPLGGSSSFASLAWFEGSNLVVSMALLGILSDKSQEEVPYSWGPRVRNCRKNMKKRHFPKFWGELFQKQMGWH